MNYVSTHKSIFCALMLSLLGASTSSPVQACASAPMDMPAKFTTHMINLAKQHSGTLCFAAIALPILGMYARKPIKRLFTRFTRSAKDQEPRAEQQDPQPPVPSKPQKSDYFDEFAEAFSKATTLIGKIFKVVSVFTATSWLDAAAKL